MEGTGCRGRTISRGARPWKSSPFSSQGGLFLLHHDHILFATVHLGSGWLSAARLGIGAACFLWRIFAVLFDFVDLGGERFVFDGLAHPLRIIAPPQVMKPGVVVDALGNLNEHTQIMRAQVELASRTAKEKAAVGSKFSF